MPKKESPINSALRQYEATEANVAKLETLWGTITKLLGDDLSSRASMAAYVEKLEDYEDLLRALPAIDGWKPKSIPFDFTYRREPKGSGESVPENEIEAAGRELAEYRHRLNRKRQRLIRSAMFDLIDTIDETLRSLNRIVSKKPKAKPAREVKSVYWGKLKDQVQEVESLLGTLPRPSRWVDLRRHLHFGLMQDLMDIIRLDWPNVKSGLSKSLYDKYEPIPVAVTDLGTLAAAQPKGHVVTRLKWDSLSSDDFERLIFNLITSARGYENPEWLMQTNAPDRGRDLSVNRIIDDSLSGITWRRVLIQCRHWTTKSVSPSDVAALKEQISIWEPPKVDVLIIATSGRFTGDAVAAIENHNQGDRALKIEMWPESHLERLLAERPALIADFGLR